MSWTYCSSFVKAKARCGVLSAREFTWTWVEGLLGRGQSRAGSLADVLVGYTTLHWHSGWVAT